MKTKNYQGIISIETSKIKFVIFSDKNKQPILHFYDELVINNFSTLNLAILDQEIVNKINQKINLAKNFITDDEITWILNIEDVFLKTAFFKQKIKHQPIESNLKNINDLVKLLKNLTNNAINNDYQCLDLKPWKIYVKNQLVNQLEMFDDLRDVEVHYYAYLINSVYFSQIKIFASKLKISFDKYTSSVINKDLIVNNFSKMILKVSDKVSYLKAYNENNYLVNMQIIPWGENQLKEAVIKSLSLVDVSEIWWNNFLNKNFEDQLVFCQFKDDIYQSNAQSFNQCNKVFHNCLNESLQEIYKQIFETCKHEFYISNWDENLLIEFSQDWKNINELGLTNSKWKYSKNNNQNYLKKDLSYLYDVWKNYLHEKKQINLINYYLLQNKHRQTVNSKQFKNFNDSLAKLLN